MASIKRIIADDPALPVARPDHGAAPSTAKAAEPRQGRAPSPARAPTGESPPAWPRRTDPQPPESILELTNRQSDLSAPRPPAPRHEPPASPASAPERQPASVPPVQRVADRLRQSDAAETPPATPRPVPRDLLPREPAPPAGRPLTGDMTVEALVRETLRPMLAEWIETYLPDMVERMVQAELRRMTDRDA